MIFAGLIGSVEVPITGALRLDWLVASVLVVSIGAAIGALNGLLVGRELTP
jgi:ribose/xylose/arabinose/galactoside ABC-type transport system permease subunit